MDLNQSQNESNLSHQEQLRRKLHEKLKTIIGSEAVYYQPPESLKMKYPCVVYNLSSLNQKYGDNKLYLYNRCYEVTIICYDPINTYQEKMLELEKVRFNRHFVSDGLNQYSYTIFT